MQCLEIFPQPPSGSKITNWLQGDVRQYKVGVKYQATLLDPT